MSKGLTRFESTSLRLAALVGITMALVIGHVALWSWLDYPLPEPRGRLTAYELPDPRPAPYRPEPDYSRSSWTFTNNYFHERQSGERDIVIHGNNWERVAPTCGCSDFTIGGT